MEYLLGKNISKGFCHAFWISLELIPLKTQSETCQRFIQQFRACCLCCASLGFHVCLGLLPVHTWNQELPFFSSLLSMISPILSSSQMVLFLLPLARKIESFQNLASHAVMQSYTIGAAFTEMPQEKLKKKSIELPHSSYKRASFFLVPLARDFPWGSQILVLLPIQLCNWAWPQSKAGRERKGKKRKKNDSFTVSSMQESFPSPFAGKKLFLLEFLLPVLAAQFTYSAHPQVKSRERGQ